jgi:Cof subfamily protein (haloacid dehalogenase superfamily)
LAHYDIKLVVSDIDGTLLPKGGNISEGTRKAVSECRKRGINFALASGRWFPSTVTVADAAGCQGPLIVANGGCVIGVDGEILQEFPMRDEDVRTTYDIIKKTGAFITSYVRGAIYRLNTHTMDKGPKEKLSYFGGDVYDVIDNDVKRFETEALPGVYKMEMYSNDMELLAKAKAELEEKGMSVSSSFYTNIEITSSGLGKGAAVKWLAEYLGVEREQVMSFGDNTNDMPMIEAAGVGVAMGNAVPELKKHADLIAPPCAEDGLARMLKDLVFNDEEE